MATIPQMKVHTRSADGAPEAPFEKPVVLPDRQDPDPARHALGGCPLRHRHHGRAR
jgi:hypothetical protein